MTDPRLPGEENGGPAPATQPSPDPAPGDALRQVRDILFRPERRRLDSLERRVDRSVEVDDVSRVLPEAIAKRARSDRRLATALQPTIESSIEASVRKNPQALTDAIFPVIGPAIRRSIQASLASVLEGFNHALENSFTPRGIGWRIEAWRTGRPFSEVVLSRTLVYRVEQVLLIHGDTGLLLESVAIPTAGGGDPELVSGMLTAIQDFVRDSFADGGGVQQVRFGDQHLIVAQGPRAVVAARVRGVPPAELETRVAETVERVHGELGDALAAFDGDTGVFSVAQPALEACLGEQRRAAGDGRSRGFQPGFAVALALSLGLTLWVASALFSADAERRAWRAAVAQLDAEPGVTLISRTRAGGGTRLAVLRDPDARDPRAVVAGVLPADLAVEWVVEPYLSLEPAMVSARVQRLLAPPEAVRATLDGSTLTLAGTAPHAWVTAALARAATIAGVEHVDASALVDEDAAAFGAALAALGAAAVRVPDAGAGLDPSEPDARDLLQRVERLDAAAARSGRRYRVELRAAAPAPDDPAARGRAEAVRRLLGPALTRAATVDVALDASGDLRPADAVRILVAEEGVPAGAPAR